jgi:hypothetical protein
VNVYILTYVRKPGQMSIQRVFGVSPVVSLIVSNSPKWAASQTQASGINSLNRTSLAHFLNLSYLQIHSKKTDCRPTSSSMLSAQDTSLAKSQIPR